RTAAIPSRNTGWSSTVIIRMGSLALIVDHHPCRKTGETTGFSTLNYRLDRPLLRESSTQFRFRFQARSIFLVFRQFFQSVLAFLVIPSDQGGLQLRGSLDRGRGHHLAPVREIVADRT